MRRHWSGGRMTRAILTVVLVLTFTSTVSRSLPALAATAVDQPQGCVDDSGWWTSQITPIQGTIAPSAMAIGDTATLTATEITIAIDGAVLKARAGAALRTAPTLADVGTPDPANPGGLLGQNQLSFATALRLVATNATPAMQQPFGNATVEFWATADGTLYVGTPDPATGNTGLTPAAGLFTGVPLGDTSWVGSAGGDVAVKELTTPPGDLVAPSPQDRVSAPLIVHFGLNGGATPITTMTCWPGVSGPVPVAPPAPPTPPTAPSLMAQTVPVANVGSPTIIHTLTGATGNAGVDPATVTITTPPAHGTTTINPITGDITYLPTTTSPSTPADTFAVTAAAPAPNGTLVSTPTVETITTISTDRPTGLIQNTTTPLSATIASTSVKPRPTCTDSTATLGVGQTATVDVLPTCTSPNGVLSPSSVQIVTPPTAGAAAIEPATGAIVYSSTSTTATSDSFTFKVVDGDGIASNIATVSIQILGAACTTSCDPVSTIPVPVVMQAHEDLNLVQFSPVTLNGDHQVVTGTMNPLYVFNGSDSLGWSVTGTVTDFVGDTSGRTSCDGRDRLCIPARNLGWQPSASVLSAPSGGPAPSVDAGPGLQSWLHPELSPIDGANPFATTPSVLCSSAAGTSIGTFACKADLYLSLPASAGGDIYQATLTLTVG